MFEYEQEYLERSDAEALSRRLPLERGPSKPGEAIKWFDGLLPEGERRDWIARQANTPSMSTYSMLEAIGAECAGAVEVKAPGRDLEPRKEPDGREEIEQYVEGIRKSPLGTPERPLTLSLAGAQAKFALVEEADGSWSWPVGGYPSTHILKPEQERFPGLVENEHACMELARRAGLPAARTRIEEFGAYKAREGAAVLEELEEERGRRKADQEGRDRSEAGPSLRGRGGECEPSQASAVARMRTKRRCRW